MPFFLIRIALPPHQFFCSKKLFSSFLSTIRARSNIHKDSCLFPLRFLKDQKTFYELQSPTKVVKHEISQFCNIFNF